MADPFEAAAILSELEQAISVLKACEYAPIPPPLSAAVRAYAATDPLSAGMLIQLTKPSTIRAQIAILEAATYEVGLFEAPHLLTLETTNALELARVLLDLNNL